MYIYIYIYIYTGESGRDTSHFSPGHPPSAAAVVFATTLQIQDPKSGFSENHACDRVLCMQSHAQKKKLIGP